MCLDGALLMTPYRNQWLRIPSKQRDRHSQILYHHRKRIIIGHSSCLRFPLLVDWHSADGTLGGILENHYTSHRSDKLATWGCEIQEKWSICRCGGDCQSKHECKGWWQLGSPGKSLQYSWLFSRNCPPCRCGWTYPNARVSVWDARM